MKEKVGFLLSLLNMSLHVEYEYCEIHGLEMEEKIVMNIKEMLF